MKRILGIFAKEPVAGRVKTRLSPPLTPREACDLYRVSLQETVDCFTGAGLDAVLFYEGDKGFFSDAFPGVPLVPQSGGGLGERMCNALRTLFEGGHGAAALIGSDSPDLPLPLVEGAFEALRNEDLVIVPARDGGYVLVGESRHHPGMFRDIPWSTDGVLEATRRRATQHGVRYLEVGGWEDLDDLPSLRRLMDRSPASSTARFARSHLGHILELR